MPNDPSQWQSHLNENLDAPGDPTAQREIEGWKSFSRTIQSAGLSEQVPLTELRKRLRMATAPTPRPNLRKLAWAVPTLAVAIAGLWYTGVLRLESTPPVMAWTQSPQTAEKLVSSAEEAANWAEKQTGLPKLVIKLADGTVPYRMTAGKGWVCYHLLVCDRTYKVTVTKEYERMPDMPYTMLATAVAGFEVSDGYVWDRGQISYYVQGPDRKTRFQIAATVAGLLPLPKC